MNCNVVIVDDDEIILFLHSKIIQKAGLHKTPKTFNSAEKALFLFENRPNKDESVLLFLDINMPVMDGWGLLDRIHQDHFEGEIKVVMVTSSVDRADKEKGGLYPMIIDFVEKPLNKEKLQQLKERFL